MSRKHKRQVQKKLARKEKRARKFFDACALRSGQCQIEIQSMKDSGFVAITSYLALGEAMGSLISDQINGEADSEAVESFLKFLVLQIKDGCLELVSAEGVNGILDRLGTYFSDKEITDVHHIATAIKHRCTAVISADRDIYGIGPEKQKDIKKTYGLGFEFRPRGD